jgi:type VII secretion-associated serine protease mycosin
MTGWAGRALVALGVLLTVLGLSPPAAHADWVRTDQWQLNTLRARTAWGQSTGGGVIVAVLDSGVDATHPDLTGQVLPGADFVDGSTDGRVDPVGHGTTVAALIAGRIDDGNGVAGLAPKARILPVRVLDKDNRYDDASTVAEGLRWAVDHGARVVNMSLGGTVRSTALAEAIAYAYAHDVVVVACTGNITPDDATTVWYPAREPGVVAVSGLAQSTKPSLWTGALTGSETVLTAPAVNLIGAKPGGYWKVEGTSFASPLVAATAALVRAKWPKMNSASVINQLIVTADDLGAAGRDPQYGYGEVDPVRALTAVPQALTRNPLLPSAQTNQGTAGRAGTAAGGAMSDSMTPVASDQPGALPGSVLSDGLPRGVEVGLATTGTVVFGVLAVALLLRRRAQEP